MTPVQILAMSAIGQAPAILTPMLRMQGIVRPPYNLIISNVPGPAHDALLERRPAGRHLPAVDPDQRDGAQHHLHVVRREDGLRPHRLPAHGAAPAAAARPTSTTRSRRWRRPPGSEPETSPTPGPPCPVRAGGARARMRGCSGPGGPHDHSSQSRRRPSEQASITELRGRAARSRRSPARRSSSTSPRSRGSCHGQGVRRPDPAAHAGAGASTRPGRCSTGGGAGTGKADPPGRRRPRRAPASSRPRSWPTVNTGRHVQSGRR